jgi:hypothetical protein
MTVIVREKMKQMLENCNYGFLIELSNNLFHLVRKYQILLLIINILYGIIVFYFKDLRKESHFIKES